MSTKHVRTTGDLVRFGLNLTIECGQCGATNILTTVEVMQKLGGKVGLSAQQRRLRCSHCNAKAARLRWVS